MNKFLKAGHLIGLAAFVGSIFGHILLGNLGDREAGLAGFAVLMQAKYMNVLLLTTSGLVLLLLTGIPLMLRRGMSPAKVRWMGVKLALVALIALNGILVLTPLGQEMAAMARNAVSAGGLPAAFFELQSKEDTFGAANLAMILAVISLAVARPALRRKNSIQVVSRRATQ
ncbi:MAG: DUF2269 family protein [Pseudomonadota bacterium]|nr:DUF2269 family protein [Pseudomonadota bacterium]